MDVLSLVWFALRSQQSPGKQKTLTWSKTIQRMFLHEQTCGHSVIKQEPRNRSHFVVPLSRPIIGPNSGRKELLTHSTVWLTALCGRNLGHISAPELEPHGRAGNRLAFQTKPKPLLHVFLQNGLYQI